MLCCLANVAWRVGLGDTDLQCWEERERELDRAKSRLILDINYL